MSQTRKKSSWRKSANRRNPLEAFAPRQFPRGMRHGGVRPPPVCVRPPPVCVRPPPVSFRYFRFLQESQARPASWPSPLRFPVFVARLRAGFGALRDAYRPTRQGGTGTTLLGSPVFRSTSPAGKEPIASRFANTFPSPDRSWGPLRTLPRSGAKPRARFSKPATKLMSLENDRTFLENHPGSFGSQVRLMKLHLAGEAAQLPARAGPPGPTPAIEHGRAVAPSGDRPPGRRSASGLPRSSFPLSPVPRAPLPAGGGGVDAFAAAQEGFCRAFAVSARGQGRALRWPAPPGGPWRPSRARRSRNRYR